MKRIFVIIIATIGLTCLHARDFYIDNMTSANTADMIQYGDIGTSLFTGQLDLVIPLYSLNDPDFNLDIILQYTSDGFKPLKNSGYVGYNWILQNGGCITREVRNYPDEFYRLMPSISKRAEGMYHFAKNHSLNKYDVFAQNSNAIIDCRPGLSYNVGNSCATDVDYLPDIFHFNYQGNHGTFMINNEGNAVILSGDYVKIDLSQTIDALTDNEIIQQPSPLTTSKITITTKDGYTYVFGGELSALEYSYRLKNGQQKVNQTPPIITTWYLSQVIAPNKRTITYYYKGYGNSILADNQLLVFNMYYDIFAKHDVNNPSTLTNHIRYSYVKECILDSICVSGDNPLYIHFYNSPALKMYNHSYYSLCMNNYKLDSIHVVSSNRMLKRANLSYDYRSYNLGTTSGFKWRFLSGVYISGTGSYQLNYNHSASYPNIYISSDSGYETLMDMYGYWKLYPSWQGLLQEVIYPTGGKQIYTYETNNYSTERRFRVINTNRDVELYSSPCNNKNIGGVRIKQIDTYEANNNLVETKNYYYTKEGTSLSSGVYYNHLMIYPNSGGNPTIVSESCNYSLLDTHIGYSYVEEFIQNNQTSDLHKNTYFFDTGTEQFSTLGNTSINRTYVGSNSNIYHMLSGMLPYNENIYKKGKLLLKKYYTDEDLVKSVFWLYNGVPALPNEMIPIGSVKLGCVDTIVVFSHYLDAPVSRKLYIYPDVLTQQVVYDYSVGSSVSVMTNRNFLHDKKLRLIRETIGDSKWITHFTKYTYPDDIGISNPVINPPALGRLISAHRIGTPIEQVSGYIGEIDGLEHVTSGAISLYTNGNEMAIVPGIQFSPANNSASPTDASSLSNDNTRFEKTDPMPQDRGINSYYPFLYRTLSLSVNHPVTDYQPMQANDTIVTYDERYRIDCEYKFNKRGRLVSIQPYGGIKTQYTWLGDHPIKKRVGDQEYRFTYIPHVGVKSITDPRGITTYYTYDAAGRLIEEYQIMDGQKQILNVYQYHVKTE